MIEAPPVPPLPLAKYPLRDYVGHILLEPDGIASTHQGPLAAAYAAVSALRGLLDGLRPPRQLIGAKGPSALTFGRVSTSLYTIADDLHEDLNKCQRIAWSASRIREAGSESARSILRGNLTAASLPRLIVLKRALELMESLGPAYYDPSLLSDARGVGEDVRRVLANPPPSVVPYVANLPKYLAQEHPRLAKAYYTEHARNLPLRTEGP